MFRKGNKKLGFNLDEFFRGIHFCFKHSSARRDDYVFEEEVTEVAPRYAMQHTETRSLTMKYVAVRILQQWKSFWKFLPKKSNLKSTVVNTDRYKRISAALQNPLAEAYTSFCAYSTTESEDFLL